MARGGDNYPVVYVNGDIPQLPIQLGQLLVDSSVIEPGTTNLQQCTSQDPLVYEPLQGGYPATEAEIAAGVTPYRTLVRPGQIQRYKSGSLALDATNDWSAALQAAVSQCHEGGPPAYVPKGFLGAFYRCNSTVVCPAHVVVTGDGFDSILQFYGCGGFTVAQSQNVVDFNGLRLVSVSAGGAPAPQAFDGISYNGTAGNITAFHTLSNLLLSGWKVAVELAYTWNTALRRVITSVDNDTGLRLFGQSVNNAVCGLSQLSATNYSIRTVKDGATQGEGLMIADTFVGEGAYGIASDGFLSLNVSNCIIDLITDVGLSLNGVGAFMLTNCWIFAANTGIDFAAQSVAVDQVSSITGSKIQATAANGKAVAVGDNNTGISIAGGTLVAGPSGTGRCLHVGTTGTADIALAATHLVNLSGNASVYAGTPGVVLAACTGDVSVEYGTFPTVASAPNVTLPKAQGDVFAVSGTTSITSITATGMAGRTVQLIFTDALTFTDGSNLKLNGNFVTTADDTITLVCDGTNFYELARSAN